MLSDVPDGTALSAFRRGDDVETARLARRDLDEATAVHDVHRRVEALCMLARVALRAGNLTEVASRATEAAQVARSAGERRLERMPVHLLAVAARMSGRFDEGRALYLRSIALNEELGEAVMVAGEYRNLAYLELRSGDPVRARELFGEAAVRFERLDAPAMAPYLAFDRATVASLDSDAAAAAAHLRAAKALWADLGEVPDPDDAAEIADLERRLGAR